MIAKLEPPRAWLGTPIALTILNVQSAVPSVLVVRECNVIVSPTFQW